MADRTPGDVVVVGGRYWIPSGMLARHHVRFVREKKFRWVKLPRGTEQHRGLLPEWLIVESYAPDAVPAQHRPRRINGRIYSFEHAFNCRYADIPLTGTTSGPNCYELSGLHWFVYRARNGKVVR